MEVRRQNKNYLIGWGWVRVGSSYNGGCKYLARVYLSNEQNKKGWKHKEKKENEGNMCKKKNPNSSATKIDFAISSTD